jgi:hypothetical protein
MNIPQAFLDGARIERTNVLIRSGPSGVRPRTVRNGGISTTKTLTEFGDVEI